MIIATIGHQDYNLTSIADAEALLKILDRSKAVRREFTAESDSYYREDFDTCITVEISSKKFVTLEEHQALKKATHKANELKKVAA